MPTGCSAVTHDRAIQLARDGNWMGMLMIPEFVHFLCMPFHVLKLIRAEEAFPHFTNILYVNKTIFVLHHAPFHIDVTLLFEC